MEETNGRGKSGTGIRTRDIALCLLCGASGVAYYERLDDKLSGIPGEWSWLRCPACGLFWLNPRPIPEDRKKLYEHYHTHTEEVSPPAAEAAAGAGALAGTPASAGAPGPAWGSISAVLARVFNKLRTSTAAGAPGFVWGSALAAKARSLAPPRAGRTSLRRSGREAILSVRFGYAARKLTKTAAAMGWFLSFVPSFRERAGRDVLWLEKKPRGRLLEIGCGNGEFLDGMRTRGWDVVGVEPDPVANGTARQRFGLDVLRDPIEEAHFEAASFDAIAMNNVIEHLENPVRALGECARWLRKGGELVIVTPNVESLGHRVFGRAWRGLEPPRHFFLFSLRTLKAAFRSAAGWAAAGAGALADTPASAGSPGFARGATSATNDRPLTELKIVAARTTATGSQYIWRASRSLRRGTNGERRLDKWESRLFSLLERALAAIGPFGEEIVLIARKK